MMNDKENEQIKRISEKSMGLLIELQRDGFTWGEVKMIGMSVGLTSLLYEAKDAKLGKATILADIDKLKKAIEISLDDGGIE